MARCAVSCLDIAMGGLMKKTPFDYGKLLRFLERPMLGGFAELRKVTLSLVMSVCLSLSARNNWAPTGRISMKFDI